MTIQKENIKFKIIQDFYPLLMTIIGFICAFLATELLVYPNKNLNEGSILLYITITTLISSITLPLFSLANIDSNKSKYYSLCIGILTSLIVFIYSNYYDQAFFEFLLSFSQRGGVTAISLSLLLFQLAKINYNTKIEEEEERKRELLISKKELLEAKKEIVKLKKDNIKDEK